MLCLERRGVYEQCHWGIARSVVRHVRSDRADTHSALNERLRGQEIAT
jgi:hypothetical protein